MDTTAKKVTKNDDGMERKVSFHLGEEQEEEEDEADANEETFEYYQQPPPEERKLGTIIRDSFGFYKKRAVEDEDVEKAGACAEGVVHRYLLCNGRGVEVRLMTLGATVLSVRMPDNKNIMGDVLLGFDTLEDYMNPTKNSLGFGSVLGRFSSFISNAQVKIGKEEYCLSANVKGLHHKAGGFIGFDKVVWDSSVSYDKVVMSMVSPDGDEGYPGLLMVQISFHLTQNSRLVVSVSAVTSKPTVLSLGHNLYLNMAGHEKGCEGLEEHSLLINADRYVKMDDYTKAPNGRLEDVGGSYFDLRVPRPVWKAIKKIPGGGYDHTFCLTKGYPAYSVTFATRLIHPQSGRYVEVMTDMPGVHINTGTELPDPNAKPPLEAQAGFTEELGYPQFCREEKKLEELARELEVKGSQTWPRQDPRLSRNEIADELKVEVGKGDEGEKVVDDEDEEAEDESKEEEEIPTEFNEKYLRDEAESEEEEKKPPAWTPPQPIIGKNGAEYKKNGGVCLIAEEFPDCMAYPHFPKPIVKPGETFNRTTVYKFGVVPIRTDREKYFFL